MTTSDGIWFDNVAHAARLAIPDRTGDAHGALQMLSAAAAGVRIAPAWPSPPGRGVGTDRNAPPVPPGVVSAYAATILDALADPRCVPQTPGATFWATATALLRNRHIWQYWTQHCRTRGLEPLELVCTQGLAEPAEHLTQGRRTAFLLGTGDRHPTEHSPHEHSPHEHMPGGGAGAHLLFGELTDVFCAGADSASAVIIVTSLGTQDCAEKRGMWFGRHGAVVAKALYGCAEDAAQLVGAAVLSGAGRSLTMRDLCAMADRAVSR